MAESETVQDLLVKAESAAAAGDLASADELLHAIARIQEEALGPQHPDLANTLNNLAIVAEKTGRPGDAEKFYRRAVAIASASLPADDPMVAASRQNLEDFCRAQGVPIDRPGEADLPAKAPAPTFTAPNPAVRPPTPAVTQPTTAASQPKAAASQPEATTARSSSRSLAKVAIAIVALVVAAFFALRPRSTRETSAPSPRAEPAASPSAQAAPPPSQEPVRPLPAAPVPVAPSQSPAAARPEDDRNATAKPTAPTGAPGAVTLVEAQLCRTFSTSGAWQCVPANDSVAPGPIVLYTRVKSPRDTVVVHRWYRGNRLRRSVQLEIRANATEGYRTFSRQTVTRGEEWRVEVRSAAGELLHEQRLAVR